MRSFLKAASLVAMTLGLLSSSVNAEDTFVESISKSGSPQAGRGALGTLAVGPYPSYAVKADALVEDITAGWLSKRQSGTCDPGYGKCP